MASPVENLRDKLEASSISDKISDLYLPLQMTIDKKTEMYVKFAKTMIIFQGPYTAERFSALNNVKIKFNYASCVLSDETYREQRKTACTAEKTEEYYEYFKQESQRALEEGNNLLVIDPTMSNLNQNRYYVALAHEMQYVILVVPPVVTGSVKDNWPPKSQALSFLKLGTFIQSSTMFQHLFCAWYLHDVDSHELRHEAGLYVQDCMENIPEFKELFSKVCISDKTEEGNVSSETNLVDIFMEFFNLDDKRLDLAYCVTKIFSNNIRSINEYFKNEAVRKNYGKMSKLFIAGFIVSPHMIAARVKLTHHQKALWEMEDEIDEAGNIILCPSDLFQQSKDELPSTSVKLISSKSNHTMINTGRTIHDPTENISRFARGRGCHIVLGKSPHAPSRNVDFDVQFALRRENKAIKAKADIELNDLERCVVKRIGKYWYIYLKEMLSVDGFFASCVKPFPYENALR